MNNLINSLHVSCDRMKQLLDQHFRIRSGGGFGHNFGRKK
ncbi:hypothetical protein EVA_05308 [gut metagenome]|uniref:Uncharacterized protein n=1 Tax=gut metagenome TaxID=749906 RepID=J9GUU4_9ZZZZ